LPARRLAGLGATPGFHHGLLQGSRDDRQPRRLSRSGSGEKPSAGAGACYRAWLRSRRYVFEGLVAGVFAVLPDVDAVSLRKAPRQTQSLITRGRAQLDDARHLADGVAAARPGIRSQNEIAMLGRCTRWIGRVVRSPESDLRSSHGSCPSTSQPCRRSGASHVPSASAHPKESFVPCGYRQLDIGQRAGGNRGHGRMSFRATPCELPPQRRSAQRAAKRTRSAALPRCSSVLMFERYVSIVLTLTCSWAAIVPEPTPRPLRSKTSAQLRGRWPNGRLRLLNSKPLAGHHPHQRSGGVPATTSQNGIRMS
jgi:hypothetical protein